MTPPASPSQGGLAAVSDDDVAAFLALGFVCTQCGRDDLPPAGDWDPPICLECDAAINFDAEIEAGSFDDELGLG
jgi:hypothetical protein